MMAIIATQMLIALILVLIVSHSTGQSSSSGFTPLPSHPHISGDGSLYVVSSSSGINNSIVKTLSGSFIGNTHADILESKDQETSSSHSFDMTINQRLRSLSLSSLVVSEVPKSSILSHDSIIVGNWSPSRIQLNERDKTEWTISPSKSNKYSNSSVDMSPDIAQTVTSASSLFRIKLHSSLNLQPSLSVRHLPSAIAQTPPLSSFPTAHFMSSPPPRRNSFYVDNKAKTLSSQSNSRNDSNKVSQTSALVLQPSNSGGDSPSAVMSENSVDSPLTRPSSSVLSPTYSLDSFSLSLSHMHVTNNSLPYEMDTSIHMSLGKSLLNSPCGQNGCYSSLTSADQHMSSLLSFTPSKTLTQYHTTITSSHSSLYLKSDRYTVFPSYSNKLLSSTSYFTNLTQKGEMPFPESSLRNFVASVTSDNDLSSPQMKTFSLTTIFPALSVHTMFMKLSVSDSSKTLSPSYDGVSQQGFDSSSLPKQEPTSSFHSDSFFSAPTSNTVQKNADLSSMTHISSSLTKLVFLFSSSNKPLERLSLSTLANRPLKTQSPSIMANKSLQSLSPSILVNKTSLPVTPTLPPSSPKAPSSSMLQDFSSDSRHGLSSLSHKNAFSPVSKLSLQSPVPGLSSTFHHQSVKPTPKPSPPLILNTSFPQMISTPLPHTTLTSLVRESPLLFSTSHIQVGLITPSPSFAVDRSYFSKFLKNSSVISPSNSYNQNHISSSTSPDVQTGPLIPLLQRSSVSSFLVNATDSAFSASATVTYTVFSSHIPKESPVIRPTPFPEVASSSVILKSSQPSLLVTSELPLSISSHFLQNSIFSRETSTSLSVDLKWLSQISSLTSHKTRPYTSSTVMTQYIESGTPGFSPSVTLPKSQKLTPISPSTPIKLHPSPTLRFESHSSVKSVSPSFKTISLVRTGSIHSTDSVTMLKPQASSSGQFNPSSTNFSTLHTSYSVAYTRLSSLQSVFPSHTVSEMLFPTKTEQIDSSLHTTTFTSLTLPHFQTTFIQYTPTLTSLVSLTTFSSEDLPSSSFQFPSYSTAMMTHTSNALQTGTLKSVSTLLPSYTSQSIKSHTTLSAGQTIVSGSPILVDVSGSSTVVGSSNAKVSRRPFISKTGSKTFVSKASKRSSVYQGFSSIILGGSSFAPSGSFSDRSRSSFTGLGTSVTGSESFSVYNNPSISHSRSPFVSRGSSYVHGGSFTKIIGSSIIDDGFSRQSIGTSGPSIVHTKSSIVFSGSSRFGSGSPTVVTGLSITPSKSSILYTASSIISGESSAFTIPIESHILITPTPSVPDMPHTSHPAGGVSSQHDHFTQKSSQAHASSVFISSTKVGQASSFLFSPSSSVIAISASLPASSSSNNILPSHSNAASLSFVSIPNYTSSFFVHDATILTSIFSLSTVAPPTTKDAFVSMETESPPPLTTSHTSLAITSSSSSSLLPASNISSITTFSSLSQNLSRTVAPSLPTLVATSVFSVTVPTTHSTPQPMPTTVAPSFKPSFSQVHTTPELPTLVTWVSSLITEDVISAKPVSTESESLPPASHTLPASNTTTAKPTSSREVTTEDPLVRTSVATTNQSIASGTTESATQGNSTMVTVVSTTEGAITDITLGPTNASVVTTEELLPTSVAPIQPTNHSTPNATRESTTQDNTSKTRTMPTTEDTSTDITLRPTNASMVTGEEPLLPTSVAPIQPTDSTPNVTRESTTQGKTSTIRTMSMTEDTFTDITLRPTSASMVTTEEPLLPRSVAPIQPTNHSTPNVTRESTTQGNASTIRTMSLLTTEGTFTDIIMPSTNASVVTKEEILLSTSVAPIQPTNHSTPNVTRESTTQGNASTIRTMSLLTTEGTFTDIIMPSTNASVVTKEEILLSTSVAPIQPTNHSTPNVTREPITQGNTSTIRTMSTTEGIFTDITMPSTNTSVATTEDSEESLLSTSVLPIQPTNHSAPISSREFTTQGNTSTTRVAPTLESAITGTATLPQANASVVPTEEALLPTSETPVQSTTHSMADGTREPTTQGSTNMTRVNSTTEGAVTRNMTTEGIFMTNGTTPLVSPANPTLDKSFATMEYWVMMELTVPIETDVRDGDFLSDLETNLAKSYQEARQRQIEKENEVKQLLRKLNPEDDIFLRVRRASTVNGNTAQIIDLSRDSEVQTTGELVYYINADGTNIPSMECATTFAELSLQELTLLMDMVVLSPVTAYNVIPTSPAPSRDTTFIIVLSICIPFACLFCCMCSFCTYCVICGPKRARNERTMSPDTFKMLEFKQKFPYKPYTPNQTPRPNMDYPPSDDEEEFLSRSNKRVSIGGVWEESSSAARIIPDSTSLSSSFRLPEKLPLSNRGLESSVRISEPPVVSYHDDSGQLQASPSKKDGNLEETSTRQLPAPPSSFLTDPNYVAAQMEISKILEPENVTEVKKPRKKRRKKMTSKAGTMEGAGKETATGSWVQLPNDAQPETISEARQKVHALIEEAFSLVNFKGTSSTAVTKLPSQEGGGPPKEGTKESKPIVHSHVMDLLTGRKKEFGIQTMQPNQESKVVVVPVHTPSTAETSSVLWNPYAARDELQKISPTREPASLPGDVNSYPPDDSYISKQNASRPTETERPHYLDGAEHVSTLFGDSSLDHFLKSHEYARSSELPFENRFGSNKLPLTIGSGPRSLRDNDNGRTLGDTNYLTDFEKGRRGRTSEYYDEFDITGVMSRGRPSRSLLDSIKSELMGAGRRTGDGKEGTEW